MSDDTIYRKDAIKALNREKSDWNCDYNVPIDNCIKRLNKVKSADRPQGKWIMSKPEEDGFGAVFQCSRCSCEVDCVPTNFCPNCGARMKGTDDEQV